MKRFAGTILATTLTLVGVPAGAARGATPAAPVVPRVMTCAGTAVVKPATYVLACADANAYFVKIHWTSWGASSAAASASFVQSTCAPTCSAGTFVAYPATLVLSKPERTKYGLLFGAIRYRYSVSVTSTLPLMPLSAVTPPSSRPRCSSDPLVAAEYVIPPPPFSVRSVVVKRTALPPSEPAGKAGSYKRLYSVSFSVVRGNEVLPAGHRYTQFAYVSRSSTSAPWCYLKGGSGP